MEKFRLAFGSFNLYFTIHLSFIPSAGRVVKNQELVLQTEDFTAVRANQTLFSTYSPCRCFLKRISVSNLICLNGGKLLKCAKMLVSGHLASNYEIWSDCPDYSRRPELKEVDVV